MQQRGRHRLGLPGLRYCRELPEIRARLERGTHLRHSAPTGPWGEAALAVGVAIAATTALVGGWLAGGATAFADIISR